MYLLKGVSIGDNCIIGAGSVVTKSIPANSVAVGNPCKVICTLDDYYKKRLQNAPWEAVDLVKNFYKRNGRLPKSNEFIEEHIYYENTKNSKLPYRFSSYTDFIEWCKKEGNFQ